ncbi:MAG: hypothetical protein ACTHM7_15450 [Ginsengibacter sp.]
MKKHLLLLLVFFSLSVCHAFSQTVYITKTGKKYHVQTCGYLSRSSIAISLSDAIAAGYTPCSVCDPPVKVTDGNFQKLSASPGVTARRAIAVQCSAKTQSGTRCKRMTKSPNGLCWQHGGD